MAETTFTQTAPGSPLYINSNGGVGWSAFLLPKAAPTEEPSYTLKTSWALQASPPAVYGAYFFSRQAPTNVTDFITKAWDWIATLPSRKGASIAFLKDPNGSFQASNLQRININYSNGTNFPVVNGDFSKAFGGYLELFIGGAAGSGTAISVNTDGNAFVFKYFTGVGGIRFAPLTNPGISSVETGMPLELDGNLRGCFRPVVFLKASLAGYSSFDVALKYFYGGQSGSVTEFSYPMLDAYTAGWMIRFQCSLDVWDELNVGYDPLTFTGPLRTYLAFDGMTNNVTTPAKPIPIPSFARTDYAIALTLKPDQSAVAGLYPYPTASSALLVFSERKVGSTNKYYLAPQGDFNLGFATGAKPGPGDEGRYNLLCGISGTETIVFRPASTEAGSEYVGDVIRYYPKQAAYAPVFPFPKVDLFNPPTYEGNPLLNGDYRTAWANVLSSDAAVILYSSQPSGSMLYSKDSAMTASAPGFLGFFEPVVNVSSAAGFCFPMVFYQGFSATTGDYSGYEFQIVLPTRKALITGKSTLSFQSVRSYLLQLTKGLAPTAPVLSTTPQGLLLTISNDGKWSRLELAKNVVDTSYELQFTNLTAQLKSAFQTNQQFLVITDGTYLGKQLTDGPPVGDEPAFYNRMTIDEWTFDIRVGKDNLYADYRNVLIFKFCDGKLKDRAANPQGWTEASKFNQTDNNGTTAVSQWIQDYIADAELQYSIGNTYYKNFVDLVNNPNWNGILALKVDLNLKEMPVQIQGLLAGIDLSRFYAHHLGIEVNRINATADLKMEDVSSMFGMISYIDQVYAAQLKAKEDPNKAVPPAAGDYDFKVLILQVLFENTAIKDFMSKAQLTTNILFSDKVIRYPTTADEKRYATLVYNGTYQDQDGASVYAFNVVNPGQRMFFDSNILSYQSVSKSQFNTLVRQDNAGATQVETRFMLWGYLHYEALPKFDIYSFGAETGYQDEGQGYGLYYSNLYIALNFALETPTVTDFQFNAFDVSFDPKQSTPRIKSMFAGFALKMSRLIVGSVDKAPGNLNYLPTVLPISTKAITGEWYGLDMEINMGGPGALASAAGFKSTMLLAWAPGTKRGDTQYNAYIGVQLPGTSNDASLLSLQGVLKVAVGNLFMQYYATENYYALRMNDISLKILGIAKLPPNGNINFFVFGNPGGGGNSDNLGWYAAYNKNVTPPPKPPTGGPVLVEADAPPRLTRAQAIARARRLRSHVPQHGNGSGSGQVQDEGHGSAEPAGGDGPDTQGDAHGGHEAGHGHVPGAEPAKRNRPFFLCRWIYRLRKRKSS